MNKTVRKKIRNAAEFLPLRWRSGILKMVKGRNYKPPPGWIGWGTLRRTEPINKDWGLTRGRPIDRYYIENFMNSNKELIKGRVLEVGDNVYTMQYGGDQVIQSDILHVDASNPEATIVDDLAKGENIPTEAFDCFICTQTLHLIPDTKAALNNIYRLLKPGGVFLGTVPGISYHNPIEAPYGYFSMFTRWSAQWHFSQFFNNDLIEIKAHGNVLTSIAFLHGMVQEELTKNELDYTDDFYQLLITIKAVKPL